MDILCLDFDGVIHSYTSGWKGADIIPDPPVKDAIKFICNASHFFDVHIFSSRSNQEGGIEAMQDWLVFHIMEWYEWNGIYPNIPYISEFVRKKIKWPTEKPPAKITIDDRAITFTGEWPSFEELLNFEPWYKKHA